MKSPIYHRNQLCTTLYVYGSVLDDVTGAGSEMRRSDRQRQKMRLAACAPAGVGEGTDRRRNGKGRQTETLETFLASRGAPSLVRVTNERCSWPAACNFLDTDSVATSLSKQRDLNEGWPIHR